MKMMSDMNYKLEPFQPITLSKDLLGSPELFYKKENGEYKLYLKGISGSDRYELYFTKHNTSNPTLVLEFTNALPFDSWFYKTKESGWYKVLAFPSLEWSDLLFI